MMLYQKAISDYMLYEITCYGEELLLIGDWQNENIKSVYNLNL